MNTPRMVAIAVACFLAATICGPGSANADTFTLDPPSPTLPAIPAGPADLLADTPAVPAVTVPFAGPGGMGLVAGDVVDAISDGIDPVFAPHTDYFSVSRGTVGAAGTGVFTESTIMDTPPGITPGHASDIFVSGGLLPAGVNILAPAPFGWTFGTTTGDEANAGLVTPSAPPAMGDNMNAYDLATIPAGAPVLFSLAAGSPTLGFLGASAADILGVGGVFGPFPVIVIPAVAGLGLPFGADIDALAISFFGPAAIEYSLTTATAPLVAASLGSGATILGVAVGPVPITVHTPAALGLLPTDELDGLDVDQFLIPEPSSLALLGLGMLALAVWRRRGTIPM